MFLDITYFQNDLYIPNLRISPNTTGVGEILRSVGQNTLEGYILQYETQFLRELLGEELHKNFIYGLTQEIINPIWVDLKGRIFIKGDKISFSPAANYVYYQLSLRGQTQSTVNGEVRATEDNAIEMNNKGVLVKVWNDMWCMVHEIRKFLLENWDAYKGYSDRKYRIFNHKFVMDNIYGI